MNRTKMRAHPTLALRALIVVFLVSMVLMPANPAFAQSVIGKDRAATVESLKGLANIEGGGVRSGSCLRPIGGVGTEEFSVYLLLPVSLIEGFVIEMSGDDGDAGEVVANAGIASFSETGDTLIRGNLGMGWVAEAYRVAANFIRSEEMYLDESYEAALSRVPTESCPIPYTQRDTYQ